MKRLVAVAAVIVAGVLAAPAHAEPGAGPGMCSFQGEYFVQYYPCTEPPAWVLLPHSSDDRPGAGTAT